MFIDELSLFATNALLAAVIFACGVGGGTLPLIVQSCGRGEHFLGIGSAFGGGVFIAAGFVHLLPDSREELDPPGEFPLSTLICSATVVTIMLIEAVARGCARGMSAPRSPRAYDAAGGGDADPTHHLYLDGPIPSSDEAGSSQLSRRLRTSGEQPAPGATRLWTAITLALGLSFHSLLAGLSMGVLQDKSQILSVFAAIIAHKSIAAFALGTAFVRARASSGQALTRCQVVALIVTFSLVTPVGVLVGTALGGFSSSSMAAALTAVAAGTFIYVGLIEISSKELGQHDHANPGAARYGTFQQADGAGSGGSAGSPLLPRAAALALGYALMALLALWVVLTAAIRPPA